MINRTVFAFTVVALLLGGFASACGHFAGQSAFLWPFIAHDGTAAAPACSSLPYHDITIDAHTLGLSADVPSFPLLIRLNAANFPEITTRTEAGGADLRFRTLDNTPLPYEIEEWTDNTSGSVWVLVDSLSENARTTIRMCFGQPGAVSESSPETVFGTTNGFLGVWHLNQTFLDATSNGHTGVNNGTADAPGIIAHARSFDETADTNIEVAGLLGQPATVTLSSWVRLVSIDVMGAEVISMGDVVTLRGNDPFDSGYFKGIHYSSLTMYMTTPSTVVLTGLGWKHLAYVINPALPEQQLFIDGSLVTTTTHPGSIHFSKGPNTFFGLHGDGDMNFSFGGDLDEVRISGVARSPDWIKLSYENQKPGSTLVTIAP